MLSIEPSDCEDYCLKVSDDADEPWILFQDCLHGVMCLKEHPNKRLNKNTPVPAEYLLATKKSQGAGA